MMARSAPKLRVVPQAPAPAVDPRPPEDLLAFLFAREAALADDLADVRRQLGVQRARYALQHRLGLHPRIEQLRARFGPRRASEAS